MRIEISSLEDYKKILEDFKAKKEKLSESFEKLSDVYYKNKDMIRKHYYLRMYFLTVQDYEKYINRSIFIIEKIITTNKTPDNLVEELNRLSVKHEEIKRRLIEYSERPDVSGPLKSL